MANETIITVTGNLTSDPELRFTPNGHPVANFTIASTPRKFDRQSNEFKDGETLFLRCSAWRELGENIAESLHKGTAVVAQGRLESRSYETKEGEKRTVMEFAVDAIGPDLKRATAVVTKNEKKGNSFGGQQQSGQSFPAPTGFNQPPQQQANDPWGNSNGQTAEPPF